MLEKINVSLPEITGDLNKVESLNARIGEDRTMVRLKVAMVADSRNANLVGFSAADEQNKLFTGKYNFDLGTGQMKQGQAPGSQQLAMIGWVLDPKTGLYCSGPKPFDVGDDVGTELVRIHKGGGPLNLFTRYRDLESLDHQFVASTIWLRDPDQLRAYTTRKIRHVGGMVRI